MLLLCWPVKSLLMRLNNLGVMLSEFEKKVLSQGYEVISGIDEVGRGPLAGPVVAAAVALRSDSGIFRRHRFFGLKGIRDSKHLSQKQREEIFAKIKQEPEIEWRVSFVYPWTIDKINIWQATQLAWRRSLKKLDIFPDYVFLDGRSSLNRLQTKQEAVVKGDQKILVLALASIVAKVSRDKLMERLSRKYPQYGLKQHKGYATRLHLQQLKKFGPCQIHRKSFRPVFENLSFKEKVYYVVSQIPKGSLMSYKEVAQRIGHIQAYRAVGNALSQNHNPQIPCHRVVRSDGRLGNYNQGYDLKAKLIKAEQLA